MTQPFILLEPLSDDEPYERALSEIVLREAPFIEGGSGGPADDWTRAVSESVVRYWAATTADAYLRIRAREVANSPVSGWAIEARLDPVTAATTTASDSEDASTGASHDSLEPDVFISHASEDKVDVARPLAGALTARGWTVWLDELELTVGDSLNGRLNSALARSRFGVVILSPAFFSKHWPQRELDALATREAVSGSKVILPVWHGVDLAYLAGVAPMLGDRLGVSTEAGIDHVAEELVRALERARDSQQPPGRLTPLVRSVRDAAELDSEAARLLPLIDQLSRDFLALGNAHLRSEHARLYTATLGAVKAARPNHAVVSGLREPVETAMSGIFQMTAAEARTGLGVMRLALLNTP